MANDVQDFRLNIGLDTDTALKDAENLQKEIKKIFESRSGQESPQLNKLDIQLKTLFTKIQKVVDSMRSLGEQEFMTSAFAQATKELEKVEKQYDSLMGKADRMNAIEQRRAEILGEIEANNRRIENLKNTSVVAGYNAMINSAQNGGQFDDTQYQKALSAVRQLNEENNKLQSKLAQLQYVKLDNYYNEVDSVKKKLEELRDLVQSMEISGSAYVAGKDTAQFAALSQQLDETIDKTKLRLVQRETQAEKEQDIINREVATERAAVQSREDFFRELTQVILNECATREMTMEELAAADRREKEAEITASQAAVDAEQKLLNMQMERRRKAEEAAIAHNQSYNRVREGLMGIQSTTRGIARLIPGLNTSAIYGVTAITRGVARLANMTRDEWAGAIDNVRSSFGRLFAFIASHPVITTLIAVAGAVIGATIAIKNKLKDIGKESVELAKTLGKVAVSISKDFIEVVGDGLTALAKGFAKLNTVSIRILIFALQNLKDAVASVIAIGEDTYKLLVKLNNGINDINLALSNLTSSLDYLEAAFSTAFSPILTYVEPVLTRFIDLAGNAMNAVGMLFAKLLGQDSYSKVIRKQTDFNKELDKTNKKAKESLASFDKLNVISKTSNRSKKDKDDLDVDFEEVDLSLMTVEEIIEDIKQEGHDLGKNLNDWLSDIEWGDVSEKAQIAAEAVGGFINSFFSHPNLGTELGEFFGGAINAVSDFIAELFGDDENSINVDNLADQFVKFVRSAIKAFDPEKLSKAVSNMIKKLVRFIKKTVAGIKTEDVKELATKLGDAVRKALKNIPWDDIKSVFIDIGGKLATFFNTIMTPENVAAVATAIAEAFNTAMVGISAFVDQVNWHQLGLSLSSGINTFLSTWDFKATAKTLNKLASGILDTLKTAIIGEEYTAIITSDLRKQTLKRGGIDWTVLAESLLSGLKEIKWGELVSSMIEVSTAVMEGITTVFETIRNDPEMSQQVFEALAKLWVEKKKWEKLGEDMIEYIEDGVAGTDIAKSEVFKEAGTNIANVIIDAGKGVGSSFGIPPELQKLIAKCITDDLADTLFDTGEELGESNVKGLFKGLGMIGDAIFSSDLSKSTKTVADEIVKSEKSQFEIHSPSKLMAREVGLPILAGILNGMEGYEGTTKKIDIGTSISTWWENIMTPFLAKVGNIWGSISKTSKPLLKEYKALVTTKNKEIKDNLKNNNSAIKTNFIDTWTKIGTGLKTPLQSIINTFASFTDKIIDCTNSMITNLNTLKIDMPEWLTGSSDKTFSFGLSKISHVDVPKLAQGAVIPPSMSQFLAVLGDNKRETEVVSPLSTIEQALRNVMGEQKVTFEIVGDPHGMFRVMQKEAGNYTRATGRLAF